MLERDKRLVFVSIRELDRVDSLPPQRAFPKPMLVVRHLRLEFGIPLSKMVLLVTLSTSTDWKWNAFILILVRVVILQCGNKWQPSLCRFVNYSLLLRYVVRCSVARIQVCISFKPQPWLTLLLSCHATKDSESWWWIQSWKESG